MTKKNKSIPEIFEKMQEDFDRLFTEGIIIKHNEEL